jgi:hypothetical protein
MPVLVAELAKRVCQNSHRIAILARIILARGLRPGERRGGRKKGTPNRRTSILRDLAIDGNRQLAIDHMAEVLEYYTQKVTASSRHRCQCSRCSGSSATRLAKYQSPQLQAIAVQQTHRKRNWPARATRNFSKIYRLERRTELLATGADWPSVAALAFTTNKLMLVLRCIGSSQTKQCLR